MYVYLIKYYDSIIAAAVDEAKAEVAIQEYIRNNTDMKRENFEKVAVRYFGKENSDDE